MDDGRPSVPIYEVPWLRIFPWLRLFRCPGSAADPKRLMLAAVGILVTSAGWALLDRAFPAESGLSNGVGWLGLRDEHRADRLVITAGGPGLEIDAPRASFPGSGWWGKVHTLTEPARCVMAPFLTAFSPTTPAGPFLHATLAGLWALVVWGLIGGAIARIAVVNLAASERVGVVEALRFSARKVVSLLGTPLVPLLGVVLVAASMTVFGLLYRLPGSWGPVVAGALAFLPLVGGVLLTLIVVGLAVGWPLMHASVAAEAEDGFDAMSRAYAYVHQRPWHYAAFVAVAVALGCLGLVFVALFAGLVMLLAAWALAFGGPSAAVNAYYGTVVPPPDLVSSPAMAAHGFWLSVVRLLARGWVYSYFWTTATAIYLLLRLDVDGTPWGTIAYKRQPSALIEAANGSVANETPTLKPQDVSDVDAL